MNPAPSPKPAASPHGRVESSVAAANDPPTKDNSQGGPPHLGPVEIACPPERHISIPLTNLVLELVRCAAVFRGLSLCFKACLSVKLVGM